MFELAKQDSMSLCSMHTIFIVCARHRPIGFGWNNENFTCALNMFGKGIKPCQKILRWAKIGPSLCLERKQRPFNLGAPKDLLDILKPIL